METARVRDLHRGDVVMVRDRAVTLREDPFVHGSIMAFRYRAGDILIGLMTAPADHRLELVRTVIAPREYAELVAS